MRDSPLRLARLLAVLAAFAAALAVAGCGKPTGNVSGKVTYKGNPVKGGSVVFAQPNGQDLWADIQEDGSYSFTKVDAGPVKVAVKTSSLKPPARGAFPGAAEGSNARGYSPPAGQENPNKPQGAGDRAKLYVPIPEKYEDPKTSGKEYTVKSGKQEFDITLD
jgi:hypothetical protein